MTEKLNFCLTTDKLLTSMGNNTIFSKTHLWTYQFSHFQNNGYQDSLIDYLVGQFHL